MIINIKSLFFILWALCSYNFNEQESQHPLTGQRAANFRLLANQWAERRLLTQWRHGCRAMRRSVCNAGASNGVGPFAFIYQGNGATSCQYIDTTRKAIDCTTTFLLTIFIQWNFAADFSSFIVEIVQKTTSLGNLSPFWESYGRRRTLLDDSLESPCRVVVKCNWTSFYSARNVLQALY